MFLAAVRGRIAVLDISALKVENVHQPCSHETVLLRQPRQQSPGSRHRPRRFARRLMLNAETALLRRTWQLLILGVYHPCSCLLLVAFLCPSFRRYRLVAQPNLNRVRPLCSGILLGGKQLHETESLQRVTGNDRPETHRWCLEGRSAEPLAQTQGNFHNATDQETHSVVVLREALRGLYLEVQIITKAVGESVVSSALSISSTIPATRTMCLSHSSDAGTSTCTASASQRTCSTLRRCSWEFVLSMQVRGIRPRPAPVSSTWGYTHLQGWLNWCCWWCCWWLWMRTFPVWFDRKRSAANRRGAFQLTLTKSNGAAS